jgi:hypothetical protein
MFEKEVSSNMGLEFLMSFLSPFLNNGLIAEYFHHEGNEPDIIDLLQINFK